MSSSSSSLSSEAVTLARTEYGSCALSSAPISLRCISPTCTVVLFFIIGFSKLVPSLSVPVRCSGPCTKMSSYFMRSSNHSLACHGLPPLRSWRNFNSRVSTERPPSARAKRNTAASVPSSSSPRRGRWALPTTLVDATKVVRGTAVSCASSFTPDARYRRWLIISSSPDLRTCEGCTAMTSINPGRLFSATSVCIIASPSNPSDAASSTKSATGTIFIASCTSHATQVCSSSNSASTSSASMDMKSDAVRSVMPCRCMRWMRRF
mmetsp:Transcript_9781/g.24162  ORF Transcript_9781/g.24162 Transcript_9781/m.24162 type:complete len:265 (+) Transcript_9781:1076-1870(+)